LIIPSDNKMQADIHQTSQFTEAQTLYARFRQPGGARVSDASDICVSSCQTSAVFAGLILDRIDSTPVSRVCRVSFETGRMQTLTSGPHSDRLPKYSPDDRLIAFLSDREELGDFQLYILDPSSCEISNSASVEGWVEYFHWSPDGRRILLGVAGKGADVAGAHGAVTSRRLTDGTSSWIPSVRAGTATFQRRSIWIHDCTTGLTSCVSDASTNIWEAVWCGNDHIVAVESGDPREGSWYRSRLYLTACDAQMRREIYAPSAQIGCPSASLSGEAVAFVEALCSDRCLVAGELRLWEQGTSTVRNIDTHGVDVTYTEWRSEHELLVAGHRRFETVVGLYDSVTGIFRENWKSDDLTCGVRYASVAGLGTSGDCALIAESFDRAPEVGVIKSGRYRSIISLNRAPPDVYSALKDVERVTWTSNDGEEIDGWLLLPNGRGPFPLIMYVHGGPVWQWRPTWLGRTGVPALMLLRRGCAVLYPNPRGSAGRGQRFARMVLGDIGGADAQDCLSAIDYLTARGIADPERLGVTGLSYGGFMTTWLISQDTRFSAAVAVGAHNNQITQYLLSNIPDFLSLFIGATYIEARTEYVRRSPVMYAHQVKTPTLNVCGALDRCTPPEESEQFHNALTENGVQSVLVTYPEEGHGIRQWPALIDFAARVVTWFEEYLQLERRMA
jgi:dipeptidyl aminopeptidase/acylaminoacyl peptidase